MKQTIVVDFDCTITQQDVFGLLIKKHGGVEGQEMLQKYRARRILPYQSLIEGMRILSKNACMAELSRTLDTEITIDPTFYDFVSFCQSIDVEMRVVSCSIDWFIQRVLARCKLEHLPVYSAVLNWNDQGPEVCFPHRDDRCKVSEGRFSVCKGSLIRAWQANGEHVSIVGDGESDFCGAAQANHVFARDLLITFCEQQGLPFTPINSFQDIREYFYSTGSLLSKYSVL
jgi:2-hydroxy-3-keto-5-methylthiopentenyl-1-phosphate phosphatase